MQISGINRKVSGLAEQKIAKNIAQIILEQLIV